MNIAISLKVSSTAFGTTVSWTLSPFSCAGCKRIDRVNIHGLRVSSRSCVAWHGTTDPQTKFRIHIRHDFQTRVLELSIQCFSTSSNTNTSKPASLISSSNVSFNLFLKARHVGVPPFIPCLEFQHRAPSWRNNCAKQNPLSSRCRWIVSFLQSSPGCQRVLLQVGDIAICLRTRGCHECCMHLLQHEIQIEHSLFHVRRSQQEFQIDEISRDSAACSADHSNIISDSLITLRTPPSASTTAESLPFCQSIP